MLSILAFCLVTRLPTVGVATRFGDPGDPPDAFTYACAARLEHRPDWPAVRARGVATREGRCGERLRVCTSTRCARAYRIDSGPYGRTAAGWRGVVDLTPRLADRLRVSGRRPVFLLRGW